MNVVLLSKKNRLKILGLLLIFAFAFLNFGLLTINTTKTQEQQPRTFQDSSKSIDSNSDLNEDKVQSIGQDQNISDLKIENPSYGQAIQKSSTVSSECKIAGCSNELCVNADEEVYSKCSVSRSNICLESVNCEVQPGTGECGWSHDDQSNVCFDGYNTITQELRVIEVRYFALGEEEAPFHPDDLSDDLQDYLRLASKYHGYDTPYEISAVDVNVVDVINVDGPRPNPGGGWQGSYSQMLSDNSLCDRIANEDIDQIWMWVDPINDTTEGREYAISSDYFRISTEGLVKPGVPFCDGDVSFAILGLDYTRNADLALHSFGHYMEGLIRNLDGEDLFWDTYADISTGVKNCGNVHFPPNAIADYQYSNTNFVTTNCEDWHADGSGETEVINCTKWGCTERGYLIWWMQNFPNQRKLLQYSDNYISNWWNYVVDMENAIADTYGDSKYHVDRGFIDTNVNLVENCSCSGTDQFGDPVSTNECGFTVTGEDLKCYQCVYSGWSVISSGACE